MKKVTLIDEDFKSLEAFHLVLSEIVETEDLMKCAGAKGIILYVSKYTLDCEEEMPN